MYFELLLELILTKGKRKKIEDEQETLYMYVCFVHSYSFNGLCTNIIISIWQQKHNE
jgi:hypothetical protein